MRILVLCLLAAMLSACSESPVHLARLVMERKVAIFADEANTICGWSDADGQNEISIWVDEAGQ